MYIPERIRQLHLNQEIVVARGIPLVCIYTCVDIYARDGRSPRHLAHTPNYLGKLTFPLLAIHCAFTLLPSNLPSGKEGAKRR